MKKTKLLSVICAVIFVLQLVAEALTLTSILRLDMLPGKYTVPVVALFVLGLVLTGLLMFLPANKSGGNLRRIFACLLAVLIGVLCAFAYTVVDQIHDTMQQITDTPNTEQTGPTRQVFVLVDDPAQTLQDAKDYTFGIVENYDVENTQGAIASIEQILGKTISTKTHETVYEMVDALYSGQCRAIILNGGYVSILDDNEQYADFLEKARILCDVEIVKLSTPEPTEPPTEPVPEQTTEPIAPTEPRTVTNSPFIMYISGSDTRSSKLTVGNSDVNILVVVNPNTKQVLLVNTPRDYYIPNPAGDGALDKLTHCGIYGIDCSIQALEDLYGIQVDYYSQINFTGFETLVNAVGGVTVYSNTSFTSQGVTIYRGENYLDGKAALVFARERYQMPGGDNGRGQNQMKVIKAIITKATTGTTIITNYADILNSLQGMFVTSMEMSEISQLVKMQLDDMAMWDVQSFAVTGNNGREITYSIPGLYASVMYQDEGYIAHASELINRVMADEKLTAEDVKYPG